jgi:hypothetical protein
MYFTLFYIISGSSPYFFKKAFLQEDQSLSHHRETIIYEMSHETFFWPN